ncbi:peptidase S1 and S6 chymotrypsin/Hap [Candidatus Magnetoovum chiemensis]|nr:peptidase S1 and S6 chymotrypsin/Hap [Candidatus Magnetoovum chiemensis]
MALIPVYRFYNELRRAHFYFTSEHKKDKIIRACRELRYEGIIFFVETVKDDSTIAVYKFFNNRNRTYIYTINENEKNNIIANYNEFSYEGIDFYVYKEFASELLTPVYRFYNKSMNSHLYTASFDEAFHIINAYSAEYIYEGRSFYAVDKDKVSDISPEEVQSLNV